MLIALEVFQALSSKELVPAYMIQSWLFHAYVFQWKWEDFYVEVLDSMIKGVLAWTMQFRSFSNASIPTSDLVEFI